MKKLYPTFSVIILLMGVCITGKAQCSSAGASLNGTIVPTTSWQTVNTFSYYFYKFVATAGNVYIFSYCPCDGGSISYSAAITIDSSNNTAVTGDGTYTNFNEGYCTTTPNDPPQVTWKCFASGTYKVLTTYSPCVTTAGTSATMAYKMETPSLCYTVAGTIYSPDSYSTGTTVPGMSIDDGWSTTAEPIGFSFCFNGTYYDSVMISSNGNIIFTGAPCHISSEIKNAAFSSYTTRALPFTNSDYTVFEGPGVDFPWIDTYPIGGGTIKFKTYGTSPTQHFAVVYNNVELYSCTSEDATFEVQLYQTTNNIEIQSASIPQCTAWSYGGQGVEGLIDETEFAAVVPPGRNHTSWTATSPEAWLFTPSCCTPLPIRLLNFQCSSKGNAIALNWATATETNNKYFTIVRSQDGMSFTPIARINGAGNSSTTHYYSYLDTTALNGTNYYKIDQTDYDGATTESYITSCDAVKLQAGAIYPNPTTNSFTVALGPSTQSTQVTISDIIGRQVLSRQYVPSAVYTSPVISVQQLQKGIYFVRISNGQQTLVRKLVIK